MSRVTPWCDDHAPIQYRNALPPKCTKCGFDQNGRSWTHGPEGLLDRRVAAVADTVEPTNRDLADMAAIDEMQRQRVVDTLIEVHRESKRVPRSDGSAEGLMQWIPSTWGAKK